MGTCSGTPLCCGEIHNEGDGLREDCGLLSFVKQLGFSRLKGSVCLHCGSEALGGRAVGLLL